MQLSPFEHLVPDKDTSTQSQGLNLFLFYNQKQKTFKVTGFQKFSLKSFFFCLNFSILLHKSLEHTQLIRPPDTEPASRQVLPILCCCLKSRYPVFPSQSFTPLVIHSAPANAPFAPRSGWWSCSSPWRPPLAPPCWVTQPLSCLTACYVGKFKQLCLKLP